MFDSPDQFTPTATALPAGAGAEAAEIPERGFAPPARRVLMVEDGETDCLAMQRYLQRDDDYDYHVTCVGTGAEGLHRLNAQTYDCLLVDYSLPDMDGLEMLAQLTGRDGGAPCPTIVVTGTGSESLAVRSIRLGAQDYISKQSMTAGALRHAVNQAIERFALERSLRLSEERARLVLNSLPVMVFELDARGYFTFAEGSGMEALQLDHDSLIGRSALAVFADDPAAVAQIKRTLDGGPTSWRLSAHGRAFEAHCSLRVAPNLRLERVAGVVVDITERRAVEEALQKSKQRTEAILSGITDSYIALSRDWRITDMNQQAEQTLFRAPKARIVGESAWTEYPDIAAAPWYTRYAAALRDGRDAHFEAKSAMNNRWYEAHVYPDREGLSIYLTDITERKSAEIDLARLYRREHRIAETLQRSLLSPASDGVYDDVEIDSHYKAAREEAQVGGDFYDFFTLPAGKLAVVVGDVSGKGLDAASRTAEVKYTLRAYLRERPSPVDAITRLNRYLNQAALTETAFQQSFVAMALLVIDRATGACETVMAGAEPPLIVRAGGVAEELELAGLPLACDRDAEYASVRSTLEQGDILLLTTDGLTEARRGREFLGLAGVADLVRRYRGLPTLGQTADAIVHAAEEYAGGSLHDDTCLLLVRRKAAG